MKKLGNGIETLLLLTLFLWGGFQSSATEASTHDILLRTLSESIQLMEEEGWSYEPQTATHPVLQSFVKTFDPAGVVLTKKENQQRTQRQKGKTVGIGLQVGQSNGLFHIEDFLKKSPAAESNLSKGNRILRVNDADTKNFSVIELEQHLRGSDKKKVSLTVLSKDQSTNTLEITKRIIKLPAIARIETLPFELCYIRLHGLYKGSHSKIVSHIQSWDKEGRYGLIIDLRGANGEDIKTVIELIDLYTSKDVFLFSFRNRQDEELALYKSTSERSITMPTMVLVDKDTVGAAEVLAAAFMGSTRGAMILGEPTHGDMLVRKALSLSTGDTLYMATRRLVLGDGTLYDGRKGIQPNLLVKTKTSVEEEDDSNAPLLGKPEEKESVYKKLRKRFRRDPVLRRAVDVLSGLKALDIRALEPSPHTSL
ncbi:MAG: hypothetical protein GKR87_16155 [Kiritimatiellae bacterium]|nr:hypothetical protein [Kiritimatiellia bacterium]